MAADIIIPAINRELERIAALLTEARRLPFGMVTEFRHKAHSLQVLRALYDAESFPDEAL